MSVLSKGLGKRRTIICHHWGKIMMMMMTHRKQRICKQNLGMTRPNVDQKVSFFPPMTNHCVETFVKAVERDIGKLEWSKRHSKTLNLSREERVALQTLKDDTSIIIKPADKGGAIVVMDMETYRGEALSQLQDTTHYRILGGDPTNDLKQMIDNLLKISEEAGIITNRLKNFLQVDNPIIPVFYLLPKIHKNLQRPPGRPIVAGMSSIFQPIAVMLDTVLNPIVGIEVITAAMADLGLPGGVVDLLLQLLGWILKRNYFLFEVFTHPLQSKGYHIAKCYEQDAL
ncbi:uncharacterized protein LOC121395443 isoform X3 [Xenopus laevis]|uniref:Uncharacterized protein LOC121395443 isoform X3 n=1 Tax=Xenopus laevis TaxID=8355 RepID=A0A8J1L5U4_XENLA|nr:uncharacterized protein LOC121395443 isoform X3 [Xenopus laevis]